jgi:hypothetical protein
VCTCSERLNRLCIERVQLLQWAHQVVLLYQHSLLFAAFPFVLFGEKSKATSGPDWALSKRDNLVKEMHLMKRSASASEPMTPAEHLHPLFLLSVCIRALCQLGHEKVLCMRVLLEKERHALQCLPAWPGLPRARQSTTHGTRRRSERASIKTKQLVSSPACARPYFRFCRLATEHSCSCRCFSFTSTRCIFPFCCMRRE